MTKISTDFDYFGDTNNKTLQEILNILNTQLLFKIASNIPSANATKMQLSFYSQLTSILNSFISLKFKDGQILHELCDNITIPVIDQENFLCTLKRYSTDLCLDKNILEQSDLALKLDTFIIKNIWNNNLEELETLELIQLYANSNSSPIEVTLSNLRKYTKILIPNAYTMNVDELSTYFGIIVDLASKNLSTFEAFNKYLASYLLDYAFDDNSILISQEFQILSKTLHERSLE